jgi:RNA recognition motif-containing protein
MSKRIYIGNISHRTTEEQLKRLFDQAGRVNSVRILRDCRAWPTIVAFVEMTDEDAKRAVALLNGHELNGKKLDVRDATDPAAWTPKDRAA